MKPFLGAGLGLRSFYYQDIISTRPPVDWFEVISEEYMELSGNPLYYLDKIRAHYPMVMHGVSLSLGSVSPLNHDYLKKLKKLATYLEPAWISDHCCFTGHKNVYAHDLLPLPYTEEALNHLAARVIHVQDFLGQPLAVENVSSYVTYTHSTLTEWEFLKALTEKTKCCLLLDLNNIYVSSHNHGFDPLVFIDQIPAESVIQFHLAGHTRHDPYLIDTHDAPIIDPVWDLYKKALQRFGKISTLIERDDHFPPLGELLTELDHVKNLLKN